MRSRSSSLVAVLALQVVLALAAGLPSTAVRACTTAVITGKVTADGRPLLWKSRDTKGLPRNEVIVYEAGKYRVLAVVNAGAGLFTIEANDESSHHPDAVGGDPIDGFFQGAAGVLVFPGNRQAGLIGGFDTQEHRLKAGLGHHRHHFVVGG